MTISFPTTASANDTYTASNKTWKYNGYAWDLVTIDLGPFANTSNAAFAKANAALANTTGVTFAGDLFFPVGSNVTIGSATPTAPLSISGAGTPSITLSGALIDADGSANSYLQVDIRNANTGQGASVDYIATTDDGTDGTNYIDLGINNSNYSQPGWTINGARDGYLYTSNGGIAIGTANSTVVKPVIFFVGGTLAVNEVMRISNTSNVGIGTTTPNQKLDIVGSINCNSYYVNANVPIQAYKSSSVTSVGGDLLGSDTYVGQTSLYDAFGVQQIQNFDCQDPIAFTVVQDLSLGNYSSI